MNNFKLLGIPLLFACFPVYAQRPPMDPVEVMGAETCWECHEEMVTEWEESAHFRSFNELTTSEAAKEMSATLGFEPAEIPMKASCVRCHFTQEVLSGVPQATAGVSCESCHGGAVDWIEEHNKKGVSRESRVDASLKLGMAHPESILTVSKSCFECHVIDDEQLVNQAGHPALSEDFEILSWYSGEVKHNFLVDKGSGLRKHANELQPIPQARRRMLYLNGKLLHLGYLLQAISASSDPPVDKKGEFIRLKNGSYTYAVQLAQELKSVESDMEAITRRVSISQYIDALSLLKSLRFETGSGPELKEAADSVFRLAETFCKENSGSSFGAIDSILDKLTPRVSETE